MTKQEFLFELAMGISALPEDVADEHLSFYSEMIDDRIEEGFSEEDIARIHAPIGLPIQAETPEEIAISIAGEMIQVRAARHE